MPNQNSYFIPKDNIPKIEEVRELENEIIEIINKEVQQNYEIKKSPLSVTTRSKVIRKYGGNYVSERGKEGYGPMPYVDSQALMIAGSQSIMSRIERDFPNVATLLK